MKISFNEIPNDLLTPLFATEFDNTRAQRGPTTLEWKVLLVGQKTADGSEDEEVPRRISSPSQASQLFGRGSVLHDMFKFWFANNLSTEVWGVALDDDGSGVQASGSFGITGTASAAGTLPVYIGGNRVPVAVAAGDSGADVAAALRTALASNDFADLPVNSGGSSTTVDIEMKNAGVFGNELDLRVAYFDDEQVPAGLSVSVTPMASGAGNPDVDLALAAIGDERFNLIVSPYTDTSNLNKLRDELVSRWGPLKQNDGFYLAAKVGDDSALSTLGGGRNNFLESIIGYNASPTPPWQLSSGAGGQVARSASIDPARPFQRLRIVGALAPKIEDRFSQLERNNLLKDGLSTTLETADGGLIIERLRTTYKTNSAGAPDISYRNANTVLTLSYLRFDWNATLARKYPRHKLADDGTQFAEGQAIVTPGIIKGEAVAKFKEWEFAGLVENLSQFKNDLIVLRNPSDPDRIDVLLPPDLVNQLRIAATQISFLL